MKKHFCVNFNFVKSFDAGRRAAVFMAAFFLFSVSFAGAQDAFPPETVKAFSDARLPLLKEKISPVDFSLPLASAPGTLQKTVSLSGLKGKVVFLNFWATWCGPCRAEMPSMEKLYSRYREKGLEILALNCREKSTSVLAFMRNNGLSFPSALDIDGRVSGIYGVQAIPVTYLIDRDGKIAARVVGSLDWDTPEIRAALERLLN